MHLRLGKCCPALLAAHLHERHAERLLFTEVLAAASGRQVRGQQLCLVRAAATASMRVRLVQGTRRQKVLC